MEGNSEFTHDFFQESSKAWKSNKVRYGQAMYKYMKNVFPAYKYKDETYPKQTKASKERTERELRKRQAIDEAVPQAPRRSARIREIHIKNTYATVQ